MIDGRPGDPDLLGDVHERGEAVAALGEQARCGVEDLLAPSSFAVVARHLALREASVGVPVRSAVAPIKVRRVRY